jgi:hypothetical protein
MIKRYSQFIKESNEAPGPNTHGKKIPIQPDEMELFNSEPLLQKLVSDKKVSLFNGEVWYAESDKKTKEVLDQYLEISKKL